MDTLATLLKAFLGFAAVVAILAGPVAVLTMIMNRRNGRIIRAFCEMRGWGDVEVKSFRNHYGVSFSLAGATHYVKCLVRKGEVKVVGKLPAGLNDGHV